jgi:hypothetical protein
MPRQRHETRLDAPITHVFAALIDVVARGRWGTAQIVRGTQQPRPGCEYAQQRRTVFRRGKVLECLRPVKLTLEETLLDRPCRVKLRLQWRLEPLENGSCVLLEAKYSLNGAAILRRRHWYERIHGHCARMLGALGPEVAAARRTLEEAASARPPRRAVEPMLISALRARRN